MRTKFFYFVLFLLCLGGIMPASAAFKDIKIDLTKGNLLTAEEISGKSMVSFGVVVGDDGSATRVAADDATANIVLNGKYHSNEHGWGNFSATVAVDGPVKVSMGSCKWGGDVTVKNAAGDIVAKFNTNNGACYDGNNMSVVSAYYKGTEATTLTISGGSYTPYIAVEKADPSELVEEGTVTFALGDVQAEGDLLPEAKKVEIGKTVTIPANHTLYIAGKTLTGWTDGTNTYAAGEELTVSENVTLTPVFTDNAVSLADRTDAVTLNFDFQTKNGAPTMAYQNKTGIYVTQAVVNGQTIDVKLDFDTNNGGKIANANWNDWCQMNSGTKLTVPSCKGAVVSVEGFEILGEPSPTNQDKSVLKIDGQTDYTHERIISYTIANTAETIDVIIGAEGSYYRYVKVVLPVVQSAGGKTYTNEPASVVWAFNDVAIYESNVKTPSDAFSVASVNIGDATLTGSATGQAVGADGNKVTFIKVKPKNSATDVVEWSVTPSKGLTFTPTKVSGYIQRFGTDSENGVTVTARLADGTEESLGVFTAPRNNKIQADDKYGKSENYTNQFVIELTEAQQNKLSTQDAFSLFASIGVGNTKEGGFSDIHIEGLLNGTVENVAKYTVSAKAVPEEAATIVIYPNVDEYDEGSEVKLTAVKNFGYKFVNWTDANGAVVSENEQFVYTVAENAEFTANYEKLNTYALSYNVTGGANDYMVKLSPAPVVVEGKNMYEEGAKVTMTASGNPIFTFTNWSIGDIKETSSEITVDMTNDTDVTANFDAVDFVAAWDFELSGSDGRKADFYSADNDIAQLVLRKADGSTSGWLDKSNASGGYEGRPGAVNWRTTGLGEYYWQTQLNCAAFTDINVKTAMTFNYNAYSTYNVEYSLDGQEWKPVAAITIPGAKTWVDADFNLPEECNNRETLYLRWIADKTSEIMGTQSNNDGICLGATWILGKAQIVDDGTAPKLVSTVPAEGDAAASANGKIVLTFDEKVKVADGATATLGEQTLKPAVSGKTVVFEYKGLDYSTPYTFKLAGNKVADLTDNYLADEIVINFTTKTRPVVTKAMYDFIVPDDGTFNEAIKAANSRTSTDKRFYIFVKDGSYKATNIEGATVLGSDNKTYPSVTTDLTASNVSIIGESMEGTVIYNEPTNVIEGLGKATNLCIKNKVVNTYIQDLTLTHTLGDNGRVAVLQDLGNKTVCKTVKLDGFQDTYYSNQNSSRFYFETSTLGGRVDFCCGGGDVVYNQCDLVVKGDGTKITAASAPAKYGYVFLDCTIKGNKAFDGKFTLGRPWSQGASRVQYINTTMELLPTAAGWDEMSGGWAAVFKEYNSHTANGTPVSLDNRKNVFGDNHSVDTRTPLTDAEVAELTIANVMGGTDNWDPTALTEQASAPTNVQYTSTTLTWDNSNYVLCWAVCKDGKVVAFTTAPTYAIDDATATWSVRAANEMGGLGEATVATVATGIDEINGAGNENVAGTAYYNLQGIRVSKDYKGVVIKVDTMLDGKQVSTKIMK